MHLSGMDECFDFLLNLCIHLDHGLSIFGFQGTVMHVDFEIIHLQDEGGYYPKDISLPWA